MWTNSEALISSDQIQMEFTKEQIRIAGIALTAAAGVASLLAISTSTAPLALTLTVASGVGGVSASGLLAAAGILSAESEGTVDDEKVFESVISAAEKVLEHSDPTSKILLLDEFRDFQELSGPKSNKVQKALVSAKLIIKIAEDQMNSQYQPEDQMNPQYQPEDYLNHQYQQRDIEINGEFSGYSEGRGRTSDRSRDDIRKGQPPIGNSHIYWEPPEPSDWYDKAEKRTSVAGDPDPFSSDTSVS